MCLQIDIYPKRAYPEERMARIVITEVTYSEGTELVEDLDPSEVPFLIEQLEAWAGGEQPSYGMGGWRPENGFPPCIRTVAEVHERAHDYFEMCANPLDRQPLTITGLAIALGMTRQTMSAYEKGSRDVDGAIFSEPIHHYKAMIENAYEKNLHNSGSTGSIFALKNMGWQDVQSREISGPGGTPIATSNESTITDGTLKAIGDAIIAATDSDSK